MGKQLESRINFDLNEFNERFERLKSALEVFSDAELANVLGIKPQAIYGAKQRRRIPRKWLDFALSKNISLDYIFDGEQPCGTNPKTKIEQLRLGDYKDRIAQITSEIIEIAIAEANEKPEPLFKMMVRDRVHKFVIENVIIKAKESFKEYKALTERSGSSDDIVHAVDAILTKLN